MKLKASALVVWMLWCFCLQVTLSSAEALPVRLQRHAEEDRRVGVLRRDGANSIKTLQY